MLEEIQLAGVKIKIQNSIESYKFRDGLSEVIDLARKGNKYMQEKEPWIVAKQTGEDGQPTAAAQQKIDNCWHICLQLTANLAIYINPFLPFTAKKMIYMMKVVDKMLDWDNAGKTPEHRLTCTRIIIQETGRCGNNSADRKTKNKKFNIKKATSMETTTDTNNQSTNQPVKNH